jgi:AraC-like DNA-binding protein
MVNVALGPGWTRRAATCRMQGLASSIQLLQQGRDAQNGRATRLWATIRVAEAGATVPPVFESGGCRLSSLTSFDRSGLVPEGPADLARQITDLRPGFEVYGIGGPVPCGSFRAAHLGGMMVAEIVCDPVHARWRPGAVSGACPQIKVVFQVSGIGMTSQDGRSAISHPGDFCFLDDARPFDLWGNDRMQQHSIEFPRSLVADHLPQMAELTAVRIDGLHGPGRFLRGFVEEVISDIDESDQRVGARLRDHAVDLLLTAISERQQRAQALPNAARGAQLRRAKSYILERLSDPQLSVEVIAAGLKMSVRYLYCLFESEGLTVARWVREQRLARCRRALEDVQTVATSICTVALRNGFNDAAYFSTAFRAAYGITPRACRRAALACAGVVQAE